MEQQVIAWITQYGYIAIFSLLVLGIVGLPVPDETLLTFTGYLVFKGHLSFPLAFLAAFLGSASGITISYVLGRTFGVRLIHRYGRYLHLDEKKLAKAHAWFERAGHWSLTFGYYIPGVRHFTAYAAGMSELAPRHFALYAYSGACIWVTSFLSLGYFLGERWESVQKNIDHYFIGFTIAGAVAVIGWWIWRKRRKQP